MAAYCKGSEMGRSDSGKSTNVQHFVSENKRPVAGGWEDGSNKRQRTALGDPGMNDVDDGPRLDEWAVELVAGGSDHSGPLRASAEQATAERGHEPKTIKLEPPGSESEYEPRPDVTASSEEDTESKYESSVETTSSPTAYTRVRADVAAAVPATAAESESDLHSVPEHPGPIISPKDRWHVTNITHCDDVGNLLSLRMASNDRSYRLWQGEDGSLESTLGALIPDGYSLWTEHPTHQWICPVRDCRRLCATLAALGGHFIRHRKYLMNDNQDGTFTVVGTYSEPVVGEKGLPALVISRRTGNAEPLEVPAICEPLVTSNYYETQSKQTRPELRTVSPPKSASAPLPNKNLRGVGTAATKPAITPVQHAGRPGQSQLSRQDISHPRQAENQYTVTNGAPSAPRSISPSQKQQLAVEGGIGHKAVPVDHRSMSLSSSSSLRTQSARCDANGDFIVPIPGDAENMWLYILPYLRQTYVPPSNGHVPEVIGLPRRRNIRWNETWRNGFFETLPRDITALIMHLTGDYPPQPCKRCQAKKGPFHGCIIMSALVVDNQAIISCSNCWYHGLQTQCSLRNYLRERLPPPSSTRAVSMSFDSSGFPSTPTTNLPTAAAAAALAAETPMAISTTVQQPIISAPEVQEQESIPLKFPASAATTSQPPSSISTPMVPSNLQTHAPMEALEMEDWEVGPGRIQSKKDENDSIAFSNAYLAGGISTGSSVAVADGISFHVNIIRPGTSRTFKAEKTTTRICSLASGKLKVKMQDESEFALGPHGMFKIRPGVACTVENRMYLDCLLHVSSVVTGDV